MRLFLKEKSYWSWRWLRLFSIVLFQGSESADPSWIRVFLLDMQLTDKGVMVLMAAFNPNISQQLHYALGNFSLIKRNLITFFYRCWRTLKGKLIKYLPLLLFRYASHNDGFASDSIRSFFDPEAHKSVQRVNYRSQQSGLARISILTSSGGKSSSRLCF